MDAVSRHHRKARRSSKERQGTGKARPNQQGKDWRRGRGKAGSVAPGLAASLEAAFQLNQLRQSLALVPAYASRATAELGLVPTRAAQSCGGCSSGGGGLAAGTS